MELRWLQMPMAEWEKSEHRETGVIVRGTPSKPLCLVLQYRDGVTHDAPWVDVPIAFPEALK